MNDKMNSTLIHLAGTCQAEAIRSLIASACDLNERDEQGKTALMHAVIAECYEVVEILLQAGAEVNQVDIHGQSALMFAVLNGNLDCTKLLLENGAIVNLKNVAGQSAINFAKRKNFRLETNNFMLVLEIPRLRKSKIMEILERYQNIQCEN